MTATEKLHHQFINDHGCIRQELVEDLLVEVISGKSIFESGRQLFACRQPTMTETDRARIVHRQWMFKARDQNIPTREDLEKLALDQGIFEAADREEIKSCESMVQRMSLAREHSRDARQKVELAAQIDDLKSRMMELRLLEEEVFLYSAEARADAVKLGYLVSCCALTGEMLESPIWPDWTSFQNCRDYRLIEDSRAAFLRSWHGLPIKIIRAIARTGEWRGRWKASQETSAPVFDGSPSGWDANKRHLTWWSDFYDSVYRHPECPGDDVIRNDDALQEWMNGQIAKNKKPSPGSAPQVKPRTFLAGDGRRIPAHVISNETTSVNTPYRVKV